MELKFYYSFKEFKNDFEDNFKKWQKEWNCPDADLNDFKNEYLKEYEDFYEINEYGKVYYKDNRFSNEKFMEIIEEIENDKEFQKYIEDVENSCEYQDFINKNLTSSKIDEKEIQEEGCKWYSQKNFEYSVVKIVEFLMKEEYQPNINQSEIQKPKFKTKFSNVELAELVKALIEYGNFQTTAGVNENDIYIEFAKLLNIDLGKKTLAQNLDYIENKKNRTSFLESLTMNLNQFFDKKLK